MEISLKKIGSRIRARRKELDLSQENLAEKCGCSSVFISHVELGRSAPSFHLFLDICNALEITPDALLLDVPELYNRSRAEDELSARLRLLDPEDLETLSGIVEVLLNRRKRSVSNSPGPM